MGVSCSSCSDDSKTVSSKKQPTRRRQRKRYGFAKKADSDERSDLAVGIVAAEDLEAFSSEDLQIIEQWKLALDSENVGLLDIWLQDYTHLNLANFVFALAGDRFSSLQYAIEFGKTQSAVFLIESGKCQLDWRRPTDGRAALHFAVLSNNPDLVRLLLAKEVVVDFKDFNDDSPADLASESKLYEMLVILKPGMRVPGSCTLGEDLSDLYGMVSDDGFRLDGDDEMKQLERRPETPKTEVGHLGHGSHLEASADHFDKASAADIAASRALLKELQAFVVPKTDSSNPFNRRMAKKSIDKAKSRLQTVALERSKLPKLEGWIEKKSPSAPYSFQKRWVVVRDGHMLWNPKQKFLYDATNGAERESWAGQLYLFFLKRVEPVASKSNNKLKVFGTDSKKKKDRQFLWRAADKEQRDFWLRGLRRHHKYLKDMIVFLDMDQ